ncbi:MAG: HDOD domain-containing protein [Bdellovibrionales bacterium]|nr:HDOD domain-containing protein [Bdellovibrionales bacterium]
MTAAPRTLTQETIVARLDELPTLPTIVYELSRVINDPMSSTSDVEKLMANDISLTTKVLRLVNSAYYAIPGGVSSLSRAIAYIGFDTVNQLVLSASILKALETKGPQRFDMNEFWKHSIGVAIAAETVAKFVRHPMPADLFTCGLVHDMGKVALYTIDPDVMLTITQTAKEEQISYAEAEVKLGIPGHTAIGQLLAQRWQLPANIQAVIKHHHSKEGRRLTAEQNLNVDIVYLANLLTHALKFGHSGHDKILGAPTDVLGRMTINLERDFKNLLQEIKAGLDKAQDFLRVLGGN